MKNTTLLKNTNHWQAFGTEDKKKEFVEMLLKNGFLFFDIDVTPYIIYKPGVLIKAVDIDRTRKPWKLLDQLRNLR